MSKKNPGEELEQKTHLFIIAVVIVSLVGGYLGLSKELIDQLIELIISIFVGLVLSIFAGYIIESLTGDILKKISLNIKILGIKFSISAFFIATLVTKILLFGL